MNSSVTRLSGLLDEAFGILFKQDLGVNHAEPIYIQVLELLRGDEEARRWFIEKATHEIVSGFDILSSTEKRPPSFVDGDLICFVAHATKWAEFADACRKRRASKAYLNKLPFSRDIADEVGNALMDDWADKEFYKSFQTT